MRAPPAASYSRTASAGGAGATTQMFQLVTATAVVVALLAGAPLAERLPVTALAAVAVISATRLIDVGGLLQIWHGWRDEGVIALVAAVGVVGLGPLRDLLVAVALAVWELVGRAARPHDAVLAYVGPHHPPRKLDGKPSPHPDVLIYRVDAPLFFANAGRVRDRVLTLTAHNAPQLRWVILDAEAVFYVDATAAAALARLTVDLRTHGCDLAVARARNAVLATLRANLPGRRHPTPAPLPHRPRRLRGDPAAHESPPNGHLHEPQGDHRGRKHRV
ncbi:MAG: STAS domain-containing protein [Mycobacterium leprae]